MGDLFDEAQLKTSDDIAGDVRSLGGDLFDEAGVINKQPELLSPGLTEQQMTEERKVLLDKLNSDVGAFESFAINVGRGMQTIARGASLAEPESEIEKQAFADLSEKRPISSFTGEIVGEAAPFLAAGPVGGATTAGRIIGGTALGMLEGGLIARGKGGDTEETAKGAGIGGVVAGTAEAVFPVLGRLASRAYSKITGKPARGALLTPDGQPTPELNEALAQSNTSFDDLTAQAQDFVAQQKPGANPDEALRAARFSEQGIPATKGDISQDTVQQAQEARLLSSAVSEGAEPLRQFRLDQSEKFLSRVNSFVDELGVPAETGDSIKDALSGRVKLLKKEKNALYKQVADTSPEIKSMPILTDDIQAAIPDAETIEDLSITAEGAVNQFKLASARFGIDTSDEAIALLESKGLQAQPLTVGNFERYRKTLNAIDRADLTGASKVITGPVLRALDGEADLVANAVKDSGITDEVITETLKQARKRVTTLKTEFSPESITGKLVKVKRDGVTPVIEASKISKQLLTPNTPIEHLERTLNSLVKSGDKGKKGIADLQAAFVLEALNNSLKAPSRKTSGMQTIGGNQFAKVLDKFGDDKLTLLFRNNKPALNKLRAFAQTAKDITPPDIATPKGSAAVNMDIVRRLASFPGVAPFVEGLKFIVKAGADERAVRRAFNNKPQLRNMMTQMEKSFPDLASALGIAGLANIEEKEDE